ncbi:MAG: hypothetical protein CUN55_02490 [Phototrophicales bacterium]|nr:MAG: hypothetical protein CUN55_02490 [Phototrophicales bacterium]
MNESHKVQNYVRGSLIGLTVGLIAAYLYNRALQESGNPEENKVNASDLVKVSLAVLALVRQITELGSGKK